MTMDSWTADGSQVTSEPVLARLREILMNRSPLIVEHRFYRGGRAPARLVFDEFEALRAYLSSEGRPGDSFWFWIYEDCCRDDNPVLQGKIPDAQGRTPVGGAY